MTSSKTPGRKKQSLSTLTRNTLRKKIFLQKKAVEKEAEKQIVGSPAKSPEMTMKCNQCEDTFISKESLDKHTAEKHYAVANCNNTSCSTDHLMEHIKEHNNIEQLDGSSELQESTKNIEHYEHEESNIEIKRCPNCFDAEVYFKTEREFKSHILNYHWNMPVF